MQDTIDTKLSNSNGAQDVGNAKKGMETEIIKLSSTRSTRKLSKAINSSGKEAVIAK